MTGAPGSVGPGEGGGRRDHARSAKRLGIAVILVGHVTKDGASPGRGSSSTWSTACCCSRASASGASAPCGRSRTASARPARSGVFEMRAGGLVEVADPSARFVGEASRAPGLVRAVRDGGHPPAAGGGPGARGARPRSCPRGGSRPGSTATGLAMIIAVLARHGGPLAGGRRRVRERRRRGAGGRARRRSRRGAGARLGSPRRGARRSARDARSPASARSGLTGRARFVAHPERRVAEALKFGLSPVLGPAGRRARSMVSTAHGDAARGAACDGRGRGRRAAKAA